jgi:hypothetical protein
MGLIKFEGDVYPEYEEWCLDLVSEESWCRIDHELKDEWAISRPSHKKICPICNKSPITKPQPPPQFEAPPPLDF